MFLALAVLGGCAAEPHPIGTGGSSPAAATGSTASHEPPGMTSSADPTEGQPASTVDPPLGETSGGSGGEDWPDGQDLTAGSVDYQLIAPQGSASGRALPLLLAYSGTEGASVQMYDLWQVAPYYGFGDALVAVLDGRYASPEDGGDVLDAIRAAYDVDNDRTWLLSESAGTASGLDLGLELRQSWFAAYWANDVIASREPAIAADDLGFTPWGNAGPGGDAADAAAIVAGMGASGYRLPTDAPYSGSGADTHGSVDQWLTAVAFFADKRRE